MLGFFNKIEVTEPARNLRQIGPTTVIDLNTIKAIYRKDNLLVIRFGGIGYIELYKSDLFYSMEETAKKLMKELDVSKL